MRQWIRFPRVEGIASRQAHCDLPEGTFERELGREGFFGPSTQMYHRHPPTGWSGWEGPLRPRAFNLNRLEKLSNSPWEAYPVMGNAAMQLRWWRCGASMKDLSRNADGDELIFVHDGGGELYCDYGHLTLRDGDYVVLPRGTAWRIETNAPLSAILIEATGDSYQLPDKGILGNQAIFDPAVLDTPRLDAHCDRRSRYLYRQPRPGRGGRDACRRRGLELCRRLESAGRVIVPVRGLQNIICARAGLGKSCLRVTARQRLKPCRHYLATIAPSGTS